MNKLLRGIRNEWDVFCATLKSAPVREVLLWCLPALVIGLVARVALTIHFPYGYYQGDTPDFLETADRFITNHALVIHGKKAFLAPILFTFPFLLHLRALIVIPLFQHLLGLVATVAVGMLARLWFRLWRWFVVPLTVLYTVNPALLWYEHALLAECYYLSCVTAVMLAGTLLVRAPSRRRFLWLIVALFFTAGSRPEGKLFVAFGLGVTALAYYPEAILPWVKRMAVMLVCGAAIWMCSRNTQAGLLLYATVLPMAPASSHVAPGIEPYVAPLREEGPGKDASDHLKLNTVEKHANDALSKYLQDKHQKADDGHVSALAQKLAVEAMKNRPGELLAVAVKKFLVTFRPDGQGNYTPTSGGFTAYWIYDKQVDAMGGRKFRKPLMKGLTGEPLQSEDDVKGFIHAHYVPLSPDWFTGLQNGWGRMTMGLQRDSHGPDKRVVPNWPAFYLIAGIGMLLALIPRDRLWRFHLPWIGVFAGVWFAVMLTGVVNPRYRFVFEPVCLLYIPFLIDVPAGWFLGRRARAAEPAKTAGS